MKSLLFMLLDPETAVIRGYQWDGRMFAPGQIRPLTITCAMDQILKIAKHQIQRLSSTFDATLRLGYRIAYRLWRLHLSICRRETFGAQVAICCQQKVLLVRSSYRRTYSFPGGYVNRGEASEVGASRELKEETGLDVPSTMLRPAFSTIYRCGGHRGYDEIFEFSVDEVPDVSIDNREIVFAEFVDMSHALSLPLDDQVREYVLSHCSFHKDRITDSFAS